MSKLLLIDGCFNVYNNDFEYAMVGLVLVLIMIGLIIRQRRLDKRKVEVVQEEIQEEPQLFKSTDVLGLEKTYVLRKEQNYRPANKSRLKYIVYIILMALGLFLIFRSYNPKEGPVKELNPGNTNITRVDQKKKTSFSSCYGGYYTYEPFYFYDTVFPPKYEYNNILVNVELKDSIGN